MTNVEEQTAKPRAAHPRARSRTLLAGFAAAAVLAGGLALAPQAYAAEPHTEGIWNSQTFYVINDMPLRAAVEGWVPPNEPDPNVKDFSVHPQRGNWLNAHDTNSRHTWEMPHLAGSLTYSNVTYYLSHPNGSPAGRVKIHMQIEPTFSIDPAANSRVTSCTSTLPHVLCKTSVGDQGSVDIKLMEQN
ncbi:hypothetical protein ACFVJ4_43040 [Streptomyces sp. NPDC127178]|uniref:hypothetical protein n=1 Tax=unclassified Streptomyces TaxID=2593676 RepID=UPI003644B04F